MGNSLLSIDSSPTRLRCVSLSGSWKRLTFQNQFELKREPEQDIAQSVLLLHEQLQVKQITCSEVVLTFSGAKSLLHTLSFPFTDLSKIRDVLPFELESQLPIALADYAWDFIPVQYNGHSECTVQAVLYPLSEILTWKLELEDRGLRLQSVGLHSLTLASWVHNLHLHTSSQPLILSLDEASTTIIWNQSQLLPSSRRLPLGTSHLFEDIQSPKSQNSSSEADVFLNWTVDQWEQLPSFRLLAQEIQLTLMAADNDQAPERVIVLPGHKEQVPCAEMLAARLGLDLYELTSHEDPSGILEQCPGPSIPAAAALWEFRRKKSRLDLLRNLDQENNASNLLRPHLRFALLSLAAIFLCLSISFGLDITVQQRRLNALKEQIQTTFQQLTPDAGSGLQPVQYTSVLKSRLQALNNQGNSNLHRGVPVSRVLESLSAALPPEIQVQITLFAMDGYDLRLNGLAQDFKTVDFIKEALLKQDILQEVTIVGANVDQGGNGVSFSLRLSLSDPIEF